jgi:hypothetical protein
MTTGMPAPPIGTRLRKHQHAGPIRSYRNRLFDILLRRFCGRCDLVRKILVLIMLNFVRLVASVSKVAGAAILRLDGHYAGSSGLSELPAGWARTVSQGVGGSCAISVNERRTVLDVIGQLHREYGSQK